MFSKKATKIDEIFTVDLTLCSKCQIYGEDFVNFCGLLRKHELYTRVQTYRKTLLTFKNLIASDCNNDLCPLLIHFGVKFSIGIAIFVIKWRFCDFEFSRNRRSQRSQTVRGLLVGNRLTLRFWIAFQKIWSGYFNIFWFLWFMQGFMKYPFLVSWEIY